MTDNYKRIAEIALYILREQEGDVGDFLDSLRERPYYSYREFPPYDDTLGYIHLVKAPESEWRSYDDAPSGGEETYFVIGLSSERGTEPLEFFAIDMHWDSYGKTRVLNIRSVEGRAVTRTIWEFE